MTAAAAGRCALLLALLAAAWALVAAVAAARRPVLLASARRALPATLVAVVAANAALLIALLSDDFSVRYVAATSDRSMPAHLTALALWAGDAGSMLLWVLILAGYGTVAAARARGPDAAARLATIGAVTFFYLLVAVVVNPFATSAATPADGQGMQPLLRSNLLMAVHPPMLYAGLIGFTVPFAVAIAALLRPGPVDWWIAAGRRWLTVSWCLLTAGLGLGALWSYAVLGWGGYWAWDPVENAAILPWLSATALLHSARLQDRRGVLATWNLTLMAGTFALTVLAAFLTRGGVLTSVHAFAESAVGPLYLAFLAIVVAASTVLIARRAPALRATTRIETAVTRETALLGNNVLLVALIAMILAGTLHPILVQALTGTPVSVGASFYRTVTTPLLIAVLLLAGLGPLLRWRRDTLTAVAVRAAPAVLVTAAVAVLVTRPRPEVLAATFVGIANLGELVRSWRGASSRWRGALVAHTGLAVAALGIGVSAGWAVDTEATLDPGQEARLGPYRLVYERPQDIRAADHAGVAARITVLRDGRPVARLAPALAAYTGAAPPIGLPAVHRTPREDVYLALLAVEQPAGRITLHGYVKPGVNLLWAGCAITVLGGLLACAPAVRRRPAPAAPRPELVAAGEPS